MLEQFTPKDYILAAVSIVSLLGLIAAVWRSSGTVKDLATAVKTQVPIEVLDRLEVFGRHIPAGVVETEESLLDTVKLFLDDDGDALIDAIKEKIRIITDGQPNLPPEEIVDKAFDLIKNNQPAFGRAMVKGKAVRASMGGKSLLNRPLGERAGKLPAHLG